MYEINQKAKNNLQILLNIFIIMLLIFLCSSNKVYGANKAWNKVSKTDTGIQYVDRDSINYIDKGVLEIKTKYLKVDNTSKVVEEDIYTMRINCLTNRFKDISVNDKKILNAKWEEPNGDKLINDVIYDSCKNVKTN